MSKTKYIMTGGSLIQFRNGTFGVCESSSNYGRYVRLHNGDICLASSWDTKTLKEVNSTSGDWDIMKLWKIHSLRDFFNITRILTEEAQQQQVVDTRPIDKIISNNEPYWARLDKHAIPIIDGECSHIIFTDRQQGADLKTESRPSDISEQGQPAPSEITIRTSVVVKINDEEVDFNALTDDKRAILKSFGII